MDLDTSRARCFLEVVERGTVAAAAASLGYTPPAISQQIAKLERSLGVPLFDRVSGRLRPTAAAKALVPHAYAVLDALESGWQAARTASSTHREEISIAAFPSAVVNLVAPIAGRSDLPLRLVSEAEDDVALRQLSLGHVEVAVVQEHTHQSYARDPRLQYHRLMDDPLDLVIPADWAAPSSLAASAGLPWVVSLPGTPCRISTAEAWRQFGISPRIAAEAVELTSMVALIACGAGIGLVPRLGMPAGFETGPRPARRVEGVSPITRTIYAVTRKTHSDGSTVLVVRALREVAAAWRT